MSKFSLPRDPQTILKENAVIAKKILQTTNERNELYETLKEKGDVLTTTERQDIKKKLSQKEKDSNELVEKFQKNEHEYRESARLRNFRSI